MSKTNVYKEKISTTSTHWDLDYVFDYTFLVFLASPTPSSSVIGLVQMLEQPEPESDSSEDTDLPENQ